MFCLFVAKLRFIPIGMRKYDVNQAKDLRKRLHISWFPCFFRKISPDAVEISPDAVEIASRHSIGCVPTQ